MANPGWAGARRSRAQGDPQRHRSASLIRKRNPVSLPGRHRSPISILESSNTVVTAFIQAGIYALLSIAIILWIVLRRFGDVLLTLVPLLLAGMVTLEICVLIGMPLNFAISSRCRCCSASESPSRFIYIMAWRAGHTRFAAIEPDPRRDLERADHGDCFR